MWTVHSLSPPPNFYTLGLSPGIGIFNLIHSTWGTWKSTLRSRANTLWPQNPSEWGRLCPNHDSSIKDILVDVAIMSYSCESVGIYIIQACHCYHDTWNIIIKNRHHYTIWNTSRFPSIAVTIYIYYLRICILSRSHCLTNFFGWV